MTRTAALLGLALSVGPCGGGPPERTFTVPYDSMAPSIAKGDRIACTSEAPDRVERGDVVVFKGAGTAWPEGAESKTFVKRVVGLPGETVSGDATGVLVDGRRLDEPYADHEGAMEFEPVQVPPGAYFVLGDNRDGSADSRFHGTVPHTSLVATCTRVVSPRERAGAIPGT